MNKLLPILFLALLAIQTSAQDYACILPAEKQYFIDSTHYLRGMRIDSIEVNGDTTVYIPFHTPRGRFDQVSTLDSNGGSWMGSKIIALKNGTYWFLNHWNDTVVINSKAQLNDKWVMYQEDTSGIYYEAQITAIDTVTLMGSVDSMKTISITAYDKNGVATNAPAHNIQWQLSKQHGFYKVWDIYMFPYHYPNDNSTGLHQYEDYYTYKLNGFRAFALVDFKNPKETEVYDYGVGDKMFYLNTPWNVGQHSAPTYQYDSVMAMTIVGSQVSFSIERSVSTPVYQPSFSYNSITSVANIIADTNRLIKEFPEEHGNDHIYYYYPNDTSYCMAGDLYQIQTDELTSNGTQVNIWLDVKMNYWRYKIGIGLVEERQRYKNNGQEDSYDKVCSAYMIGSMQCGRYSFPLATSNIAKAAPSVNIYPNPVSGNTVYIDVPEGGVYEMTVYDVVGKQVASLTVSEDVYFNVQNLASGIYKMVFRQDGEISTKTLIVN